MGELGTELRGEMGSLRSHLRAEMGELRTELCQKVGKVRPDFATLRLDDAAARFESLKWSFISGSATRSQSGAATPVLRLSRG